MGRTVEDLADDKVVVVKSTGERLGPFKAAVDSRKGIIEIFNKRLDTDVGDTVERTVPPNRTEVYKILDIHYEAETHDVFAPFTLEVQRQGAPIKPSKGSVQNNFHISGDSPNIQVGDHNVQNVLSVMQSLVTEIERSNATSEQKAEAKSRLNAFLSHPVVTTVMGSAASGWVTSLINKGQ